MSTYDENEEDDIDLEVEDDDADIETEAKEDEETVEELREKLKKAEEIAQNQKIRAEKAEKAAKAKGETSKKQPENNFSLQDIKALSDVHDEDVDEIVEYAKFKGISIAEAKKSSVVATMLREKNEIRKTAEATSIGRQPRGSSKNSGDILLEKFKKTGELPEKEEDMRALAEARIEEKRKANKR